METVFCFLFIIFLFLKYQLFTFSIRNQHVALFYLCFMHIQGSFPPQNLSKRFSHFMCDDENRLSLQNRQMSAKIYFTQAGKTESNQHRRVWKLRSGLLLYFKFLFTLCPAVKFTSRLFFSVFKTLSLYCKRDNLKTFFINYFLCISYFSNNIWLLYQSAMKQKLDLKLFM